MSNALAPRWSPRSFMSRLPNPVRDAMTDLGRLVRVDSGQIIITQGLTGHTAYLLLAGCVKITGNENGREPLLGFRTAGDVVGEMAALSGAPRCATVTACTPTSVRAMSDQQLRIFLERYPVAGIELVVTVGDRLAWADRRRVDIATGHGITRVVGALLALADQHSQDTGRSCEIGVPVTQHGLAALAGVAPATAERVLQQLRQAGAVRLGYRSITILDGNALSALHRGSAE